MCFVVIYARDDYLMQKDAIWELLVHFQEEDISQRETMLVTPSS